MTALHELLEDYAFADQAAKRNRIEKKIWREFGDEACTFVLDMSGFSRLSINHGIVHYLSMVRRMQLGVKPIIERHNGQVIKFEADNCFAKFKMPLEAVRAAVSINIGFETMNIMTPPELDIQMSVGIDFGKILLIGGHDFFGDAVNLASRLGEDLGNPSEILITERAKKYIGQDSGIDFELYSGPEKNIAEKIYKVKY